ncbi:MFS transporter [Paenibacillus campi]|uniref:MFS transporter n=1 Tax=Paenibacillus campi TaxID=3106031 RepID=UPI002AFE91F2|nr:MFS transporter [Paenibacillus sp. SGZ-1009]
MQNDSYTRTANELPASSALAKLISPIRQSKAFTYLWLGQWIAMLGSSVTMVILPLVIYNLTGSSTMMGLAMTFYMLPNVLILPISGWIVDRTDRLRLIWLTNTIRFLIMLTAAVLMFAGELTLPLLYIGLALYGLMDGIFVPAYSALRAEIFTADIRNAANALSQMSIQAVRLLGPALGGLIVTFTSPGNGFALDSLTYLISLFCFVMLGKFYVSSRRKQVKQAQTEAASAKSSIAADLLEGLLVLKAHPWLWITIVVFSLLNICYQGIVVVLVPWLFKIHYGFSPVVYGLAMAGSGAGAVLAALLFGSRSRWRYRGWIGYGGALLSGAALLLLAFVSWAPGLVLVMVLEGFGIMMFALIWETSLQELVPIESFGRVASLDLLGSFALLPLGYLLVGWLADHAGGMWTISLFAIIGMLLLLGGLCTKGVRQFD